MNSTILLVVAILAVSATSPEALYACVCDSSVDPSAAQSFKRHDAVFEGKVVSLTLVQVYHDVDAYSDAVDVTFEVQAVWKGSNASRRIVRVGGPRNSCFYEFLIGREYLVYANEAQSGGLDTDLCSRNKLRVQANDDLESFRAAGINPTVPK